MAMKLYLPYTIYQYALSFVVLIVTTCATADEITPTQNVHVPSFTVLFYMPDTPYADAKDELLLAIEDRGMVLSYHSHVADMLHRTAPDVGYTNKVYAHADIFGFCKADLSNASIRENPHYLVLCPFAIAVYQLDGDTGVYLAYRAFPEQLPEKTAWRDVEKLLRELIQETGAHAVTQ